MAERLGILSATQSNISSQLAGALAMQDKWKNELIETIHQQHLLPFLDDEKKVRNHLDIHKVGEQLAAAAQKERMAHLQRKFIDKLQFPEIRDRQNRIPRAHKETFHWVFTSDNKETRAGSNFGKWLHQGEGIFWVSGKPASGKSTFMRYVQESLETTDRLRAWAGSESRLIITTYFFWKAGHPLQKTRAGLLQTLLYDLLRQLPGLVPKVFPERWERFYLVGDDFEPWSWPCLLSAFEILVELVGKRSDIRVFFMIDGLDECDDDHEDLVQLLSRAVACTTHVKMLLGSRPEQRFKDAYGIGPHFRMQDLTYSDIANYVLSELCNQGLFRTLKAVQPHRAVEISNNIAQKASGVFLWVTLVVRSLNEGLQNGDNISELESRLARTPPELDELYAAMLKGLEPQYLGQASHMFQMVRATTKHLNLLDFSFATDDSEIDLSTVDKPPLDLAEINLRHDAALRRLNSRCKGLLEVCVWSQAEEVAELSPPITSCNTIDEITSNLSTTIMGDMPVPIKHSREKKSSSEDTKTTPLKSSLFTRETSCNDDPGSIPRPDHLGPMSRSSDLTSMPRYIGTASLPRLNDRVPRVWPTSSFESSLRPRITNLSPGEPANGPMILAKGQALVRATDEFYAEQMMVRPRYRLLDGSYYSRKSQPKRRPQHALHETYQHDSESAARRQTPRTAALGSFEVLEIDYLHRTAKDFVERPVNWDPLLQAGNSSFHPCVSMLKSSIRMLDRLNVDQLSIVKLWVWIDWCLEWAVSVERSSQALNRSWMSHLDHTVSRLMTTPRYNAGSLLEEHTRERMRVLVPEARDSPHIPDGKSLWKYHWANTEPGRCGLGASFDTLCIQSNLSSVVNNRSQKAKSRLGCHDGLGRPLLDYIWLSRIDPPIEGAATSVRTSPNLSEYPYYPGLSAFGDSQPQPSKLPSHQFEATTVSFLIANGADPNEWYDNGTPWMRFLTTVSQLYEEKADRGDWQSPEFQQWYDVFVAFIKGGADPKADFNSPCGSYVREIFEKWDTVKMQRLQRLMKLKRYKLPLWTPGLGEK